MIEKLKEHDVIDPKTDKVIGKIGCDLREIMDKLNEVVDAVNELQISANRMGFDKPKEDKQADPCAEAQKWVGCICRFWYDNSNDTCLDYLDKVQIGKDGLEYRGKETYDWYPYCEPVLPTDKAIYKGE